MPRALTEKEKCIQCDILLEKGKEIVFRYGIKKTSIDEIAKAAGMAKGTFYHHFESKEDYIYKLLWKIHQHFFSQAEQVLRDKENLRENIRTFLINLFYMPELVFLIKNHDELHALLEANPSKDSTDIYQKEIEMYKHLIISAGIDTQKVKPGVVSNYVHTLFLMMNSDLMKKDALDETFNYMIDCLVKYIFGGASS
jgi:AcrR family transcriptional regulator